jgi:predicted  nucleic acid-binding Zn-ribbon protein
MAKRRFEDTFEQVLQAFEEDQAIIYGSEEYDSKDINCAAVRDQRNDIHALMTAVEDMDEENEVELSQMEENLKNAQETLAEIKKAYRTLHETAMNEKDQSEEVVQELYKYFVREVLTILSDNVMSIVWEYADASTSAQEILYGDESSELPNLGPDGIWVDDE